MDKVRKLILPTWRPVLQATRKYCDVQMKKLVTLPLVDIPEGKFKYVAAKVYIHGDMGHARTIVRGFQRVKYHLDVYDRVQNEVAALELCTQCVGGGYIVHDKEKKYIKIYGKSQTLGKADHRETKSILHSKFPDYHIDAQSGGMEE
ncbi:CG18662 [Drosophila busckii]|uniref:Sex-regulated protein janus-B n=1 Tax=Drosophila busckii TaxID=30019 RepID=A0A0M4E4U8_DROBS|nr:sex-regulated protein janus-A [Drosophila busckii]ALC39021.1 CG18662 [Drosophila busckii]